VYIKNQDAIENGPQKGQKLQKGKQGSKEPKKRFRR
jgi:hypothetical protein